jgi:PiT family inorganic phosphate transporter
MSLTLLIIIIAIALIFDFLNGFHDAANSIATIVATKVLTPFRAVLWAAFFNFIAAFGIGVKVATTIAKGIVDLDKVVSFFIANTPKAEIEIFIGVLVLGALAGAIAWNIITWYFGLPTSSSHALIGGFIGSATVSVYMKWHLLGGFMNWTEIKMIAMFIVISPLVGLILGYLIMVVVMNLFKNTIPYKVDGWFRRLQLVSAAAYSLAHGTNDAQKTMGIITFLLYGAGYLAKDAGVPFWVIISCHAAIALGTLSGGWRIVKTMGLGITKLRPVGGFCAETAGAISILTVSHFGIPVSTTHTITGAIVGVGATHRLSAVRWGVAGKIVWAWVLTMPASAIMAAVAILLLRPLFHI